MERKTIAGMSLGGGKKENFFFCVLEYFLDEDRWFLSSLHQVKDEASSDGNKVALSWINNYGLRELILDFPQSDPFCLSCKLNCPGTDKCLEERVVEVRKYISEILQEDESRRKINPKKYEQDRISDSEYDFSKDIMGKEAHNYIISRAFRRRLKKGFIPYWNRPIDFYIWRLYYDQLLDLFNISYDSFRNVSLMLMNRFHYLKRHFPNEFTLYESNSALCLVELLRSKVIEKRQILKLTDLYDGADARLSIIKSIEQKLNVFIYDQDIEKIYKNPKAFDSFLLAVAGKQLVTDQSREIPSWSQTEGTNFLIPQF